MTVNKSNIIKEATNIEVVEFDCYRHGGSGSVDGACLVGNKQLEFSIAYEEIAMIVGVSEFEPYFNKIGGQKMVQITCERRDGFTGEFADFYKEMPLADVVENLEWNTIEKAVKSAYTLQREEGIDFYSPEKTVAA